MSEHDPRGDAFEIDLADLIRRSRDGDLDAFESLIRGQERRIFRIAYQMTGNAEDARDIVQEVFIRVYKYLSKFKDETRFTTWIYRLSVNASIDYVKRRSQEPSRPRTDPDAVLRDIAAAGRDQESALMHSELRDRALGALDRLTPAERAVFVLKDIQGLEVKEIARIQGITRITVRRHLSRARAALKEILENEGRGV